MSDSNNNRSRSKYKKQENSSKNLALVNANVHNYLNVIQTEKHKSNPEMAEILDVEIKYYETIKRNGGPLDYDRLYALYEKLRVNPLKLLMDDPNAPLFLDEGTGDKPYFEMLEGLISALKRIEDEDEHADKIIGTYDRFGKYLKEHFRKRIDDRSEEQGSEED
ncbi:hypothetical protein [Butyrivibrio sp. XPD2006]|uniref:hypothetical protein n=1 Tax=Butyrivibrio sp. XPD2006 TaxID=1280668 RepID=UPI0003B63062|nr:hypothetical protein [Butyrivibrio sp. XPD2006]